MRRLVYRMDIRIAKGILLKSKEDKVTDSKVFIVQWRGTCCITFFWHVSALWSGLFLGAFAKLRKAIISLFVPVCPFVRRQKPDSYWTDFHYIRYLSIFRKYVKKIQDILKPEKNKGYFTCSPRCIYDNISLSSS
jgi:hypothetical protein